MAYGLFVTRVAGLAQGRMTTVTTLVNGVATTLTSDRRYRPDGLLLSQRYGNGVNETRQYDTQGRLTTQSLASADNRLYSYDANGNLTGVQATAQTASYGYDALDRLSLDQHTASTTYRYDANGNRLTENTAAYGYAANSNRLTSTPQGSLTLDAAGNTLSDGARTYTYNSAGQLSQLTVGSVTTAYVYNAQRQRTRKTVGGVSTVYHYDQSGQLIAETDATGRLIRSYVWADDQVIAQIEQGPPPSTPPADIIVDNLHASLPGKWDPNLPPIKLTPD